MKKLIGINLIMSVVWFITSVKTLDEYKKINKNANNLDVIIAWLTLTSMNFLFTTGIYLLAN